MITLSSGYIILSLKHVTMHAGHMYSPICKKYPVSCVCEFTSDRLQINISWDFERAVLLLSLGVAGREGCNETRGKRGPSENPHDTAGLPDP